MTTRASRLGDADIDALSRYFAALPAVRRPD
jgi:cytochrome c553